MRVSSRIRVFFGFGLGIIAGLAASANVSAHMAWLATDDQGHAVFWFGESPADRTYHMPEKVAAIALHVEGSEKKIKTTQVDENDLVGLRSGKSFRNKGELSGSVTYGLYHGMKLTYHVEHLPQRDPAKWPTKAREGAAIQSLISQDATGGVMVTVLQNGKPAKGAKVKLYCDEGHEEGEATTDSAGIVTFSGSEVEPGLNGIVVGLTDENATGELNGEPYKSAADYLTATFWIPGKDEANSKKEVSGKPTVSPQSKVAIVKSGLADLPEELTSFGAAIAGGKLYVYGGHTGQAHSYSNEEQSDRLWCLDLGDKSASWKEMPAGVRLQGLALVPWGERVVRIGGFTAVNDIGEDHVLKSQTSVAVFDPQSKSWSELAPLPEARSSLDAAVLGDKVYVFGGWKLDGDSDKSVWHQTAWSLDLSDANAKWQPLAKPTFQRRAISAAAHGGKLYVIGGMQSKGGPTTRVDVYDPKSDSWQKGPSLPGSGMSGFGSSAFAVNGKLYVSAMDGFVHELDSSGEKWNTVAKSDPARFFHRMLPHKGNLLMIGGANMQIGKFTEIELVKLDNK